MKLNRIQNNKLKRNQINPISIFGDLKIWFHSCELETGLARREAAERPLADKLCNANIHNVVEGCFSISSLPFTFSFIAVINANTIRSENS